MSDLDERFADLQRDVVPGVTPPPVATVFHRARRRVALRVGATAVAVLVVAGGTALAVGDLRRDVSAPAGPAVPPVSVVPAPSTSPPSRSGSPAPTPKATAMPTAGTTSAGSPSAGPTSPSAPPSSRSVAPAPASTPSVRPSYAPEADTVHGDWFWSVVLAVGDRPTDSAVAAARDDVARLGYTAQTGEVTCDRGLREALGLRPDRKYYFASVYFATEELAWQFVAAYPPEVVGVVHVQLFCRD